MLANTFKSIKTRKFCRSSILSLLLLTVSFTFSTAAISKDFYRWTDENGTTHYSSLPPTDKPSEKVRTTNIKGNPAPSPTPTSEPDPNAPDPSRTNFDESAEAPEEARNAEIRKENCKRAKYNLSTLKDKPRIRVKEGDDYRYLDQAERKEKIKESQKKVKEFCI